MCNGSQPTLCSSPEARSNLIYGEDERVAAWAKQRIPEASAWNGFYRAIGLERKGKLIAAVVYTDYSTANLSTHIAGEGHWASKHFLVAAFAYPFLQLNVRRITAYIAASNAASIRFTEHLGFEFESTMPRALPNGDVAVYRMFKENCRYLPWVNLQKLPRSR